MWIWAVAAHQAIRPQMSAVCDEGHRQALSGQTSGKGTPNTHIFAQLSARKSGRRTSPIKSRSKMLTWISREEYDQ